MLTGPARHISCWMVWHFTGSVLLNGCVHRCCQVREVLDTFRVAARLGTGSLAAYVISMSRAASDVLAVELLQKEARTMVSRRIALGIIGS